MAVGGINNWTPSRKAGGIPRLSTRFILSVEIEQDDAKRMDRSRDTEFLRRERGQGKKYVSCSADDEQGWQPYPVDPNSAIISDDYFKHECMYVWSSSIAECGSTGRVRLPILLVIPTIGMKWAC